MPPWAVLRRGPSGKELRPPANSPQSGLTRGFLGCSQRTQLSCSLIPDLQTTIACIVLSLRVWGNLSYSSQSLKPTLVPGSGLLLQQLHGNVGEALEAHEGVCWWGECLNCLPQTAAEVWSVRMPAQGFQRKCTCFREGGFLLCGDRKFGNILASWNTESNTCATNWAVGKCCKVSPGFLLLLLGKWQRPFQCPLCVSQHKGPMVILVSNCCNNVPQTKWLKSMQRYFLQFWRSEPDWANIKVSAGLHSLRGPDAESRAQPFSAVTGRLHSLPRGPPSIFKDSHVATSSISH